MCRWMTGRRARQLRTRPASRSRPAICSRRGTGTTAGQLSCGDRAVLPRRSDPRRGRNSSALSGRHGAQPAGAWARYAQKSAGSFGPGIGRAVARADHSIGTATRRISQLNLILLPTRPGPRRGSRRASRWPRSSRPGSVELVTGATKTMTTTKLMTFASIALLAGVAAWGAPRSRCPDSGRSRNNSRASGGCR